MQSEKNSWSFVLSATSVNECLRKLAFFAQDHWPPLTTVACDPCAANRLLLVDVHFEAVNQLLWTHFLRALLDSVETSGMRSVKGGLVWKNVG